MNNGKHTPGPWRVVPCTLEGAGALRRDIVSDGAEFSPAYVGGDILEDDARLIAAAPDMLEALRRVLLAVEDIGAHGPGATRDEIIERMHRDDSGVLRQARAAIRKATGGE